MLVYSKPAAPAPPPAVRPVVSQPHDPAAAGRIFMKPECVCLADVAYDRGAAQHLCAHVRCKIVSVNDDSAFVTFLL